VRDLKHQGRPKAALAWCLETKRGNSWRVGLRPPPCARRCPGWIPPGARTSAAP